MKPHLMFCQKDFDFDFNTPLEISSLQNDLIEDLKLDYLINIMSNKDDFIKDIATKVLITPLNNIDEIKYRQDILTDFINNDNLVFQIYNLCNETDTNVRFSRYNIDSQWISGTFSSAIGLIKIYFEQLIKILEIGKKYLDKCKSIGLKNFFNNIINILSDKYISTVKNLLNDLDENDGFFISCKFGDYLQGVSYSLRNPKNKKRLNWVFAPSFALPEKDDASANDISQRHDKAINETVNILGKTAESLEIFFNELKKECAFYSGCLNLYNNISSKGLYTSIPTLIQNSKERKITGLYDLSLGLSLSEELKLIDNDYYCLNKILHIITGANQGGKTTFLISIGQAQLLAQCGMFVPAKTFQCDIKNHIYTHFKKDEDTSMNSGKLDEEMCRIDKIISDIKENDLILFNDSFSSTNEQEGSNIFAQITKALIEHNVEIFSVTHLYDYSESFISNKEADFLHAQHKTNSSIPYKITPGLPTETAFGEELYNKIFNAQL